jgi:hypothetical protein
MRYILIALSAIVPSLFANAEFAKNIVGTSQGWTVLKANPNDNTVCYAMLYTQDRRGNQITEAEKPYIMVHYFSESKVRFSTYFGYNLLESQPVHLSIDSTQYKISPMNEYAITQSAQQDDEIIGKMKMAETLLIRGEGVNYSYSVDTYNLQGFDKAFEIMQENCDSNANNSAFTQIVPEKKSIKPLKKQ